MGTESLPLEMIRTGFPRVPLPAKGDQLRKSARLGAEVAALLDPDVPVSGVRSGNTRAELRNLAAISRVGGGAIDPGKSELALTAGCGFSGREGVTMPGKGKPAALAAPDLPSALGAKTHDIYLNDVAYWANVPEKVWDYTIGGYQVMKKWLSYRERPLLGRDLTMERSRVRHRDGATHRRDPAAVGRTRRELPRLQGERLGLAEELNFAVAGFPLARE